jgi:hypothetical protein
VTITGEVFIIAIPAVAKNTNLLFSKPQAVQLPAVSSLFAWCQFIIMETSTAGLFDHDPTGPVAETAPASVASDADSTAVTLISFEKNDPECPYNWSEVGPSFHLGSSKIHLPMKQIPHIHSHPIVMKTFRRANLSVMAEQETIHPLYRHCHSLQQHFRLIFTI